MDEQGLAGPSQQLSWLLDDLGARVEHFRQAVILSRDGLAVAASQNLSREDAEHLSALAAGVQSLARGAGEHFGVGEVRQTIIELEQAFLFDSSGGIRMRYDATGAPFSESEVISLLGAQDRSQTDKIPADPHTLHLVHRKEGEWVLVSRSTDAARVVKAAEPLFASASKDWTVHVSVEEPSEPSA